MTHACPLQAEEPAGDRWGGVLLQPQLTSYQPMYLLPVCHPLLSMLVANGRAEEMSE